MRIVETKVYTIDTHPEKNKVFEWIRNNWFDLHTYEAEDLIHSLNKISKQLGSKVDYRFSCFPDQGDYIKFEKYNVEDIIFDIEKANYWDIVVFEALKEKDPDSILDAFYTMCKYIYYDDRYLEDLCASNEYEFTEDGSYYY